MSWATYYMPPIKRQTAAKKKPYVYRFCCVDLNRGDVDDLRSMTDNGSEVTYSQFLRQCRGLIEWSEQHGYARRKSDRLTLKDDWGVAYYRSTYKGRKCYYLVWSGIECVWMLED